MNKKFSKHWKSSKQPRKQKKYSSNAPLHLKRKLFSVSLSKELRKKYGKRNVVLKKGDTVKIIKGKFKKKQGKVIEIVTKKLKIFVDGIQIKKQDGSKANVSLKPANLRIIELNIETKRGKFSDKVKKENKVKEEKIENKPKEEKK